MNSITNDIMETFRTFINEQRLKQTIKASKFRDTAC